MIALAIATGISPTQWAEEGERAIVTAYELLEKAHRKNGGPKGGPQMSG